MADLKELKLVGDISVPLFNDMNIAAKSNYPIYCPICAPIYKENTQQLIPNIFNNTLFTLQCDKLIKGCYHRYDWYYDDASESMDERIDLVTNELKFAIHKMTNDRNKIKKFYYYYGDLSYGIETSQSFYDSLYQLFVLSDLDKIKKLFMLL